MATMHATITRWAAKRVGMGKIPLDWEIRDQIRRSRKPSTREYREQLAKEVCALVNRLASRPEQTVD